jgi:hypothetical protein
MLKGLRRKLRHSKWRGESGSASEALIRRLERSRNGRLLTVLRHGDGQRSIEAQRGRSTVVVPFIDLRRHS